MAQVERAVAYETGVALVNINQKAVLMSNATGPAVDGTN